MDDYGSLFAEFKPHFFIDLRLFGTRRRHARNRGRLFQRLPERSQDFDCGGALDKARRIRLTLIHICESL